MKEKTRVRTIVNIALMVLILFTILYSFGTNVVAVPVSPNGITVISSFAGNTSNGSSENFTFSVQAGNLSAFLVSSGRVSNSWAAFYGNVSGIVTLQDGSGYTFFNWGNVTVSGEIFASNGSVSDWTNIYCVNFTGNGSASPNQTVINAMIGTNDTETDAVQNTFKWNFTGNITVATTVFDNSTKCPTTYTFVNELPQTSDFAEILITDNKSVIYTAILNDSIDGFASGLDLHDFQMVIGEDGNDPTTTTYYFYTEIV